jgi:nucleoside-diphosphate-sugar epimerase
VSSNVEFINVDIRKKEDVKKICKDIDYVFHTVALVPISKADKAFDEVIAGGTENLIEAAMYHNVQSIVHLSSTSVYKIPKRGDVIDENYPLVPVAAYGRAKYHSEKICLKYMDKGVPISIIRPKTILSPNRLGIYSLLFDWIMHDNPIFILGDGNNKYSYISTSDLTEAMILSAEKGIGEIFNISTDRYGTYREDIEDLIAYTNSKSKVISINATLCRGILKILDKLKLSPFSEWHYSIIDKEYVFNIAKAKRILGWTPHDSNQKMFRDSYDWFKENYDSLNKVGTTHTTKLNPKIFGMIKRLK